MVSHPIILTTSRLVIREYQETDLPEVHEYACDPETVRFMTWGPNTTEETRQFINLAISQQKFIPRTNYHFVVVLQRTQSIIGGCGIHLKNSILDKAEVGYCFNRRNWGRGFATETLAALLKFGFESLGVDRIKATCDTRNAASARVMEKNGMWQIETLEKHIQQKGEWRDSYLYAILSSEWRELIKEQV